MPETKVEICSDCGQPKPIKLELYPGRLLCDVCSTRWHEEETDYPKHPIVYLVFSPDKRDIGK